MRVLRSIGSTSALALALSLGGCGDDDLPSVPTDAGRRDAQVRVDSGRADGGDDDDGGTLDDAGARDGGERPGVTCSFDPETDVFTLATDPLVRARDVSLAAGATGFGIAWSANVEGLSQIFLGQMPSADGDATAQQLTVVAAVHRDPVIVADASGWILAWYGNPDGDFDVYALGHHEGTADGPPQRLTTREGRDDEPALLATAGGALAAWVETRGATQRVAVSRLLAPSGAPMSAQRDASSSTTVSAPVLGARQSGAILGWVDVSAASPRVLIQPLDATGSPVGSAVAIDSEMNADGTLDLATGASGGLALFGVSVAGSRPEVRGRVLDAMGLPSSEERVITVAPEIARDASAARLAAGYVVAYRALEGATPRLRLAFLADDLERVGTLDLAGAQSEGGRVTVRVSGDGRIGVAWADVGESSTEIRAARVRCE